jgi:hypothetical protein
MQVKNVVYCSPQATEKNRYKIATNEHSSATGYAGQAEDIEFFLRYPDSSGMCFEFLKNDQI